MAKSIIHIEYENGEFLTGVNAKMEHVNPHEVKHVLAQLLISMCEQDGESVGRFMIHHQLVTHGTAQTFFKSERVQDE